MPEAVPGAPVSPSPEPRWGLGEVAGGIVVAQFLGTVAAVVAAGAAGWRSAADIPMWGVALLQVPLWAGWIGAVVIAGRKGGGVVEDFGLRVRPVDVPVGVALGVLLQLVALPLVYLPVLRLLDRTDEDLSRPARELARRAEGPLGWILLLLIVGVGAPVVEELFYRGLLQRALLKRGLPPWLTVVSTSALFAAMHLEPLQFLGLFLFGLVAGALAVRTGRLGPSIAAHVGFNVTTVVVLWVTRAG